MKVKKILSLLLCAVMLTGLLPVSAFATTATNTVSVTVGKSTVEYSTLSAALSNEATTDGAVIKLLADVNLTEQLTIAKKITLDLNGYGISGELDTALLNITATEFGIIGASGKGIVNSKKAALQLKRGTVLTVDNLADNNFSFTFAAEFEEASEANNLPVEKPLELPIKIATVKETDPAIKVNPAWFSYVNDEGKLVPYYIVIEGDRKVGDKVLIKDGKTNELYLYECKHSNATEGACPDCGSQHKHNWSFEAAERAILAKCDNIDTLCNNTQQEYTLEAPANMVYDGTAKIITVGGNIDGVTKPEVVYTDLTEAPTLPGTYTASINIDGVKGEFSFSIGKATPVYTAPTAKSGLVYNASAQELITAGTATGGEMQYSLDGENYSTEIPTATDIGKHTVYYKVVGDNLHIDIAASSIEVEIAKPSPTYTAPTAKTGLTYTGNAQALIVAGSANNGTMEYSLDNSTYSTEIPTATTVGKHTVWYRVSGAEGYANIDASSIEVEIAKAEPAHTVPSGLSAVYGQTLANVSLPEGWTWKDSSSSVGNAGTNKFIAVFTPSDTANYSTVEKELEVSVAKKALTITNAAISSKVYNGQKNATISSIDFSGMLSGETLVLGTDFSVSAEFNDANIGEDKTVTITVTLLDTTAAKNYSVSGGFTLSNQTISANTNVPTVTLSFDKVTYNGSEHKPTVTVKVGETVVPASEYDVSYSDNTNAGTAKVTVTDKTGGNYSFDSLEKTFTIEKVKLTIAPKSVSVTKGTAVSKLEYNVTGLIYGEKIGANTALEFKLYNSSGSEVSLANAVKTAGTYTIKWTNMSTIQFSKVENYELNKVETAEFVVKAPASSSTTTTTTTTNSSNNSSNNSSTNKPNSATSTIKPSPSPSPAVTAKPSVSVPISGFSKSIRVDASLDGDTVSISAVDTSKLDSVIGENSDTKVVSLDLSQLSGTPVTTVKIPTTVVKEIADAAKDSKSDVEAMIIVLSDGASIGFDADALNGKVSQAIGNDISISVEHSSKSKNLTAAQKAAIGNRDAYDISVISGGKLISKPGGTISVYAPYTLKADEKAEGIVVYYVDENGARQACSTSYNAETKQVVWTTDHLSLYVIDYVDPSIEIPAENENTEPTPIDPAIKDNKDLKAILWISLIGFLLMTVGIAVFSFFRRKDDNY